MNEYRSRVVPSHNHKSFDVKPLGECRACDNYHERKGVTTEEIERAFERAKDPDALRVLAMLGRVNPDRHAEYLQWIAEGAQLADAVDAIFESSGGIS